VVVMAALHSAHQVGFVSQPLLLVELLFAHGEAKLSAAIPALERLVLPCGSPRSSSSSSSSSSFSSSRVMV